MNRVIETITNSAVVSDQAIRLTTIHIVWPIRRAARAKRGFRRRVMSSETADKPAPLLAPDAAERLLARTLARGGDFAEVYAERRHGLSVAFDDGRLEGASDGSEQGVGIRLVVGDSTYF